MNKAIYIGNITKDLDLKYTSSNKAVLKFNIAVARKFAKAGDDVKADFINCIAWGKDAENITKFFAKGNKIAIEGRTQTGSYTKDDGTKGYTNDCVIEAWEFVAPKEQDAPKPYTSDEARQVHENTRSEVPTIDVLEDDLPF